MTNELTKLIVKVGNTSSVKFSNCKPYRAIVASELNAIHKAHPDCNILVIENISEDEQTDVRDFAKQFKAESESNNVFFYIPNSDDVITSGIADELDYDIYFTLESLYEAIYNNYGVNISTFIDDKKKYNALADGDMSGLEIASFESTIEASDIKDDIDISDAEAEAASKLVETVSVKEDDKEVDDEPISDNDSDVDIANSEIVQKLKIQLNDIKYDYNQALKDAREATEYSAKLEETIKILREEKDDILERFNTLISDNDVMEDPISLSEYEKIQTQLDESNKTVKDLNGTVIKLQKNLEEHKRIIEVHKKSIENYKSQAELTETTLKEKDDTIEQLNEKIASGELLQPIIDEYSTKLKNNEVALSIANSKVNKESSYRIATIAVFKKILNAMSSTMVKMNSLEVELVSTNELLNDYKRKFTEKAKENENLVIDASNQAKQIETLKKKLTESNNNANQLKTQASNLQNQVQTANKRAELADNYATSENQKLTAKINELEASLKIAKEQIAYKDTQYRELLDKSRDSSITSEELANTNNTLDMINRTLKEKLGVTTRELETYKKESEKTIGAYKDRIQKLTEALQASNPNMEELIKQNASKSAGGSMSVDISPISYNAPAKIIPIFGSGSVGITTTAMSIISRLAANNKVLYLDFDIVTPNADAWFSKPPICKNIPGIPSDNRMSSLGIFYELGFETFEKYASSIIIQCERTKGGGIDYMSGLYYRVDTEKLVNADYSGLMNFIGNMYQYIIIDMGRLGNSEVNDNLIKAMADISTRTVVVTTGDKFETRNFSIKLTNNRIKSPKIAWLVNMCDTTTIDERTKQYISPCDYGIILKDSNIHGFREKFTKNKLNRDKLDLFMSEVLFKGMK